MTDVETAISATVSECNRDVTTPEHQKNLAVYHLADGRAGDMVSRGLISRGGSSVLAGGGALVATEQRGT